MHTAAETEPAIDLLAGSFYGAEPHATYAWLREHDPVHFDAANGVWGIARHADVKAVSKDTARFSNAAGARPDSGALPMMIDMDAPDHVRRRRLVSAGFTPRRVRALEDTVTAVCDEIIDRVCTSGGCDFVADIAAPLPMIVIGNLLGVEAGDRADLLGWSDDLLRGLGTEDPALVEAMLRAFDAYSTYVRPVIQDRRRTGDESDLIGLLTHAEVDGDRLDDDSILYEALLILIGGDETTRHVLTGGMEQLLAHPDQSALLRRDPALLPVAVEEMLRWVTPIKNMARTVTADTEFAGKHLEEGQQLLLLYPSANRDEAVFAEPERFDTARQPNDHLAFGFGAHFCLGNQLARLELRVMFERLLARLPDMARAGDGTLERRQANFVSGIESMPAVFTPSAPAGQQ